MTQPHLTGLTAADLPGLTTEELAAAWHDTQAIRQDLWAARFKRVLTDIEEREGRNVFQLWCAIEREQGKRRNLKSEQKQHDMIQGTK
jgi:hypothetical protein